MRLSGIHRTPDAPATDAVSLRSILFWVLVGVAVVIGVVLYFRFERTLVPLLG